MDGRRTNIMNNKYTNQTMLASVAAFLMGMILLWSFGKYWINFEFALIFLAGLLGVAIPVLIYGLWNLSHPSDKNHK
jgi:hypothetical protein